MSIAAEKLRYVALIYSGAVACGAVADQLNLPLPWMIGAMAFAAGMRLSDRPVPVMPMTRPIGQVIVAASVGLSFTPEAVAAVSAMFIPIFSVAALTIVAGFLVAAVLMRLAQVDVVTAALSSIPMGPVESAHLAKQHGGAAGPVVFAQTLRIMLLVVFIPPILVYTSSGLEDPTAVLRAVPWSVSGALWLGVVGLLGGLAAKSVRLGNPFFIGALGGAALATALSLPVGAFPYAVLALAQVFLGVWLGAVFDRELLRNAAGFVSGALVSAALLVMICAGIGLGAAWITDMPWQVMVLATAPGSVTEMALTAKMLQEGIVVVTAFHVVRIFIIIPFAPLIIGLTARVAKAWGL